MIQLVPQLKILLACEPVDFRKGIFPPLDGRGPVSDSDSEIPSAFARKAIASPLNVVAA
jgi:hypothetical protein